MATINERVIQLEKYVEILLSKINDISKNVEEKSRNPYSLSGGIRTRGSITPIDAKTGLGQILGNHIIWNNTEIQAPLNEEPAIPIAGYNKHSHSRYSGGALIYDELEIVEYDWNSVTSAIDNKHSQQFWTEQPKIATTINSDGETVKKIGHLQLEFDADSQTWRAGITEIDVKQCYLVQRNDDGSIKLDENENEMKSLLLYTLADSDTPAGRNENLDKSNVWWDKDSRCWRFYAVFKPSPEEE